MDSVAGVVDFERYKILDIDKLVHADWNYKQDNDALTEKLVANIKRNGQIENLLVRELGTGFYEVVNGNHRLAALKIIGCEKAVCYDLGEITQHEAYRVAIETNETKFLADHVRLAQLVHEMSVNFSMEDLLSTLPYNEQEVENYIKMHTFSMDDFEKSNDSAGSGEHGAAGTKENELHLTLNSDVLDAWKRWKALLIADGHDANDYNAFSVAIQTSVQEFESSKPITKKGAA